MHKGLVQGLRLGLADVADHLHTRRLQPGDALAGHARVRVGHGHHHPGHPRRQQGITAGGGAAVVAAGFERHHRGAAARPLTRLAQGEHLGVGGAGPGVEALPHQLAVGIEHDAAH